MANRDSPPNPVYPLSDRNQPPPGLVALLRTRELIDPAVNFEVLYGGRTNRVWKVLSGKNDAVLKLYCASFQNPLFRNDARLEAECLRALNSSGFVPNLRATGSFGNDSWVYYDHAPGAPWRDGVECVALLLRKLHQIPVDLDLPDGCNGSDDLDRHARQILASCQSQEQKSLLAMQPQGHIPPLSDQCLIHGDPVAGNILQSPDGLTLIDWQCPALGDPCEDLAMFLSPAMQQLYRGAPLSEADMAQFLAAYDCPKVTERYLTLRPWFAWRMAAYCLWRIENGSPDYAPGYELEVAAL
ncbi:aminoglycoside phosphotransferase family protein [Ruegeria sp. ANG-R]|uniref:aminoglycoside phosphotransferase family protein n=1 Tax=Ruegeria sp. ANG-R TaxID=1577903 RepID=UPI001F4C5E2D|nr:aminoglycoside phosphotransferase family protein [Ruegeria sp. ANG-R]